MIPDLREGLPCWTPLYVQLASCRRRPQAEALRAPRSDAGQPWRGVALWNATYAAPPETAQSPSQTNGCAPSLVMGYGATCRGIRTAHFVCLMSRTFFRRLRRLRIWAGGLARPNSLPSRPPPSRGADPAKMNARNPLGKKERRSSRKSHRLRQRGPRCGQADANRDYIPFWFGEERSCWGVPDDDAEKVM